MFRRRKNARIAIIGAGPSGISAALALRDHGYKNVVVFEKADRIGGKSHTHSYKGKAYDMGSMIFHISDPVNELAQRFRVPTKPVLTSDIFLFHKTYEHPVAYARSLYPFRSLALAYAKLRLIVHGSGLGKPGYGAYTNDLYQPFSRFIKKHGLEPIAKAAEPASTGFGYGFYEDVPAMYLVKFLGSMLDASVILDWLLGRHSMRYFPNGWRAFWETVSEGMDIRCGSNIEKIDRRKDGVVIQVNGRAETFDELIISSRLDNLPFLKRSREESELFSMIKSYRIVSTLVEADKPLQTSFVVENASRKRIGHVIGFENYHPASKCYVTFQLADHDLPLEKILSYAKDDCAALGSRVKRVVSQQAWDYFFYVPTEGLRKGFYPRLDALQGEQHTYYIGSLLNFETVPHCIEYSRSLVRRFFPR